ncbi:MAG: FAD-dependent oxidoreductase [Cyclobacteriaceae bacterium]
MSENTQNKTCVIIGASHAGVNFAFALRNEGWQGKIMLVDGDPVLPYHRPPLSKAYLTTEEGIESHSLRAADNYEKENIELRLGIRVKTIDRNEKKVCLDDGSEQAYNKLVIATGARPLIPPIQGLEAASNLYPLRTAEDVNNIKTAFEASAEKRVVVIGGGYIGLEIAASMKKLGGKVVVLEREERVLSRVTAPVMSEFFEKLHAENGVDVLCGKNVSSIETVDGLNTVKSEDGSSFEADIIVVGVGIRVNTELAESAGLEIENGIKVDASARTNDEHIYSIGDCTFHHNPRYDRYVRLESVQNAVDQAKIAAAAICGKDVSYNSIPWFWSDQYDVKLQMVGLSEGYNDIIVRQEESEGHKFSVWYFKDDELLAVDGVNNAKAYVVSTKFIKEGKKVDKVKLADPATVFKPLNLLKA